VYAVVVLGSILFVVTDLAYSIGPRAAWLPASHVATSLLTRPSTQVWPCEAYLLCKWLHKAGGFAVLLAYTLLMALPFWSLPRGKAVTDTLIHAGERP
jgi:hypothetical protein